MLVDTVNEKRNGHKKHDLKVNFLKIFFII